MRVVNADAGRLLQDLPEYALETDWMMGSVTAQKNPAFLKDQHAITTAVQSLYMRKLVNPDQDRSTIAGIGLPSIGAGLGRTGVPIRTWFGNRIATKEDVIQELRLLNYSDLANRLAATEQ